MFDLTLRNTSRVCRDCGLTIDRRSKRCRICNQLHLMRRRYPLERRLDLSCKDCGERISYQSAHGRGRCRNCYFEYMRPNIFARKTIRSADRPNTGTFYIDRNGNSVWSGNILMYQNERGPFKVAHAWACLRRCWKGLKIAKNKGNYDMVLRYLGVIQQMRALLNLEDNTEQTWSGD